MIKVTYDYQSSHPGYIDMEFKELVISSTKSHIYDWKDIYHFILQGYWIDIKVPSYIERLFDYEGDYKAASVSVRLLKSWCRNVFKEYGEPDKSKEYVKVMERLGDYYASLEEENQNGI